LNVNHTRQNVVLGCLECILAQIRFKGVFKANKRLPTGFDPVEAIPKQQKTQPMDKPNSTLNVQVSDTTDA
jgi:hypothetical protein